MKHEERTLQATGTVRISLPASVTYSPDRLKRSIAELAESIGHPQCFSGANCYFQMEREFVLEGDNVVARSDSSKATPEPVPWKVALAPRVKYDLGSVQRAIDKVIDLIGPHPCISGADVLFQEEMIVVNEALEAQRFA